MRVLFLRSTRSDRASSAFLTCSRSRSNSPNRTTRFNLWSMTAAAIVIGKIHRDGFSPSGSTFQNFGNRVDAILFIVQYHFHFLLFSDASPPQKLRRGSGIEDGYVCNAVTSNAMYSSKFAADELPLMIASLRTFTISINFGDTGSKNGSILAKYPSEILSALSTRR